MLNGKQYDFEDIKVKLFDKEIIGITAIEYGNKQDPQFQYGVGKHPISYTKGKYEASGEITILQSELESIQRSLQKGQSLTDIPPFDVVVSYGMEGDTTPVTDILKSCFFTEVKKGMKTGGEAMEVKLPLKISNIRYNS